MFGCKLDGDGGASFMTGLLGINVGGMPGSENPLAFWIATSMMVLIIALELALFMRLRRI